MKYGVSKKASRIGGKPFFFACKTCFRTRNLCALRYKKVYLFVKIRCEHVLFLFRQEKDEKKPT